jgi:hypothetical protein
MRVQKPEKSTSHSYKLRPFHRSKWVGIEGGGYPLSSKKRGTPPTLSPEALLSKKITKNVQIRANGKKSQK